MVHPRTMCDLTVKPGNTSPSRVLSLSLSLRIYVHVGTYTYVRTCVYIYICMYIRKCVHIDISFSKSACVSLSLSLLFRASSGLPVPFHCVKEVEFQANRNSHLRSLPENGLPSECI